MWAVRVLDGRDPQNQLDRSLHHGLEGRVTTDIVMALEFLHLGQSAEAAGVVVQIRGLGVQSNHVHLHFEEGDLAHAQAQQARGRAILGGDRQRKFGF